MAEQEMFDYLSSLAADYTVSDLTFTRPTTVDEDGDFNILIREGDDDSEERVALSSTPTFSVMLSFAAMSEVDIGTIFDWYFDTGKAHGMGRSFYWVHPEDGHTYTVRFSSKLQRSWFMPSSYDILRQQPLSLKILGTKP